MMPRLEILLTIAGGLHFGILIASALVPQVLDWKGELAKLPELFRQLVWVHGAYIVLMIVGFGLLSVCLPDELAGGTPLARAVCGFIAVFWGGRLMLQYAYFRPAMFLTTRLLTIGYHGLTAVFLYLTTVYTFAAVE